MKQINYYIHFRMQKLLRLNRQLNDAFSLVALLVLSWYGINYNTFNTLKHSVDILISVDMLTRLLVILRDLLDIGLVISDTGVNR